MYNNIHCVTLKTFDLLSKAKEKISKLNRFDENKIEGIIRQAEKDERKFQTEYDYNTFHSYVLSEQKRYEKEVDSLLNLLTEYKEPKIEFNDKNTGICFFSYFAISN